MWIHSPAGGACAARGEGLSPSDPTALSGGVWGDTGTPWPRNGSCPGVLSSVAEPVQSPEMR